MPAADRFSRLMPAAMAAACAAIALAPLPAAVRTPFALCLVAWLPGRAILSLAFPSERTGPEIAALSVVLSMAAAVLCGLALHFLGALTPAGWAVSLSGIAIAAFLVAPAPGAGDDVPAAGSPVRRGRVDLAMLAGAVALGLGAYAAARSGAEAHDQYRYTELWMVPAGPVAGSSAILGIRNAERAATSYEVEIVDGGKAVGRWPRIDLEPGETRTMPVTATRGPRHRRLEARLFKDGDRDLVYRHAWIDVPAGAPSPTGEE
jgi:uncharacterized membrane protein